MEEDQELKFVCKLCYRKYPCGKSLGGHMRSHVVANSAEIDEKVGPNMKKFSSFGESGTINDPKIGEFGNGQSSYGLRENPRKSWRVANFTQERMCKQCGKGFPSLKALCGHMASHSEKDTLGDDHSWSYENQKLLLDSHSDTVAEDRVMLTRPSKGKKLQKRVIKSPLCLANSNNNGSSSVSDIDGEEQEEVAMCLMLLSGGSGGKGGGVNTVVESSDNNSVILETKSSLIDMKSGRDAVNNVHDQEEIPLTKKVGDMKLKENVLDAEMVNSDSGYFLDECANAESDVSVDIFRERFSRSKSCGGEMKKELMKENDEYDNAGLASICARIESRKRRNISEESKLYNEYCRVKRNDPPTDEDCNTSQMRERYECFNCKKTCKYFQALGEHRPCHEKRNKFYESRYESIENSLDDSTEVTARGKRLVKSTRKSSGKNSPEKKINAKKNKGHACPFCDRVFKNGQALGGHKRSHFIVGHHEVRSNPSPVTKPDLLDLNLPAPQEHEDDGNGQW